MFGGDRAAFGNHRVEHDAVALGLALAEGLCGHVRRLAEVEMQVAVAEVAEHARTDARHGALEGREYARHECRDARDRHRDVVLQTHATALLGRRDVLAQPPQLCGAGGGIGNHRVADPAGAEPGLADFEHGRLEPVAGQRAVGLDEHVPRVRTIERIAGIGQVGEYEVQGLARQELAGRQGLAERRAQLGQQRQAGFQIGNGQ